VDADLVGRYISGMNSADLYDSYKAYGNDPYIVPEINKDGFSVCIYAKLRSEYLCNNLSKFV